MTDFNFLKVSKSYMSYERMGPIQKIRFWLRVPFVYWRFCKLMRREKP